MCDFDIDNTFLSFFDSRSIIGEDYQNFKEQLDKELIDINFTCSFETHLEKIGGVSDSQSNIITNLPVFSDESIANTQLLLSTKEGVKRGRRRTKNIKNYSISTKEPIHTKESIDNIRRKIKTHFAQFIISFMNEVIAQKYQSNPKLELKSIDYKVIKNITQRINQKLFQMKLKDFLLLPLSTRVKFNRNQNENIVLRLIKANIECIIELFDMTINDFYDTIYLGKPEVIKSKYELNESRTKKQFDSKNQLHFFEEDLDSIDKKEDRYYNLTKEIGMTLTDFFNNRFVKASVLR